jgi:hypothetical protein
MLESPAGINSDQEQAIHASNLNVHYEKMESEFTFAERAGKFTGARDNF